MNQKTKYNLLLLLSITAYAGDEPKEQNQNTVNNQNEQQIVENLVNPENRNLQAAAAEEQALSLHAQKENTKLTGQRLLDFACNLYTVTPYLTLKNTLGLATQNTQIHGAIAACACQYLRNMPAKNLLKIKQAMKSGKLNLFVSPLASEKHHYYPVNALWNPFFDGRQKEISNILAQNSVPHIFTHCQPDGKQYRLQGDFTKKYPIIQGKRGNTEVPLVGEIALTHPLALHLTKAVYDKISDLRRRYDREPTGDYNSTQEIEKREKIFDRARTNPLNHYNEILQLRKTPLIVENLTDLKKYDSNLLEQVVRCQIDPKLIETKSDRAWILDTIKKYNIQVSASLSLQEGESYDFACALFKTGLVSELTLSFIDIYLTGESANCLIQRINAIPQINTVKSLTLIPKNDCYAEEIVEIILKSFNKMPQLKKFLIDCMNLVTGYGQYGAPSPKLRDLEELRDLAEFRGLEELTIANYSRDKYQYLRPFLPKNVPNLYFHGSDEPGSLILNRCNFDNDRDNASITILQDFYNLKSLNYPLRLHQKPPSVSNKTLSAALLKHQNLESLALDLFAVKGPEQVEEFYQSLSALQSLKEIIIKTDDSDQNPIPGATLLFKSSKEYPALSKISFDFSGITSQAEENRNDLAASIADLLFQAFDTKSDCKIKDNVVFDLIFSGNKHGIPYRNLRGELGAAEREIRNLNQKVENHPQLASWSKEMKSAVRKRVTLYGKDLPSGIIWRIKPPDLN